MGRQNRTKQRKIKYYDYSLFFLVIFLLGFGLVMLYSVSAYSANLKYGDPLHYLKRQGLAVILGMIAMVLISRIDYHVWIHFGTLAYLLAVSLCLLVLFIGSEKNGSARWLRLSWQSWLQFCF